MCLMDVQVCGASHIHTTGPCGGQKTAPSVSPCLPPCLGQSLFVFHLYICQAPGGSPISGL